jgi:DNA polymerase (family 10)
LLLRREAYAVDLEAVLQAAKKHDKWVEINANPMRLDLDWVHCRRAREIGVKLVTNPDAHAADELANTIYGVEVARRGWVGPAQLANTLDLNGVLAELEARRKKV